MGWTLEQKALFDWEWSVVLTAFGAAVGSEATYEAAVVEMVLAEADLLEEPYPAQSKMWMRADPKTWVEQNQEGIYRMLRASGFGSKSPSYGDQQGS